MKRFSHLAFSQGGGGSWTNLPHFCGYFINNLKQLFTFSKANFLKTKPEQNFKFSNFERNSLQIDRKFTSFSILKQKCAFTLAEVLITLGIIGVVAAITLPQLTAKYQQIVFSNAFKKEYNVLNNAINYLNLNDGLRECYFSLARGDSGWYYNAVTSNCHTLKQSLISKLNLQPIENDISYTDKEQVSSNGGVVLNNSVVHDSRSMKAYSLPDGAVVMFVNSSTATGYGAVAFVIDVNGKKGPNKWGYDVFWLTLVKKGDTLTLTDEYASLSEKGGSLPRNILLNKWSNDYNAGVWK